ncbi:MAG: hypothetical protein ACRCVG_05530 [Methanobacteriaceae archaeon]
MLPLSHVRTAKVPKIEIAINNITSAKINIFSLLLLLLVLLFTGGIPESRSPQVLQNIELFLFSAPHLRQDFEILEPP